MSIVGFVRIESAAAGVIEAPALFESFGENGLYRAVYEEVTEGMQRSTAIMELDISGSGAPKLLMVRRGEIESLHNFSENAATKGYYKVAGGTLNFDIRTVNLHVRVGDHQLQIDVEAAFLFAGQQPLSFSAHIAMNERT